MKIRNGYYPSSKSYDFREPIDEAEEKDLRDEIFAGGSPIGEFPLKVDWEPVSLRSGNGKDSGISGYICFKGCIFINKKRDSKK